MTNQSNVKLTLDLSALDTIDTEELEKLTRNLLREMRDLDVESAELVLVENTREEAKAVGSFLPEMLTAEVTVKNIKAVLGYLHNRLTNKTIKMDFEANGKKLKVKASTQQKLITAIEQAQKFVTGS